MNSEGHPTKESSNTIGQFIKLYLDFNCLMAEIDESFLAARLHELLGNRKAANNFWEDWHAKVTNPRIKELYEAQGRIMEVLRTRFPTAPGEVEELPGQDWNAKSPEAKASELEAMVESESANASNPLLAIRAISRASSIAFAECVLALENKKLSDAFSWLCGFRHVKAVQSKWWDANLRPVAPVIPDRPPRAA